MDYINQNPLNLKLTSEINKNNICFLDLNIFIDGGRLKTKTHFNQTDIYSYIGFNSHHYKYGKYTKGTI